MIYAIYAASVVGAVALAMMLPKAGYTPARSGALLGAAALGGLWLFLARYLQAPLQAQQIYLYIFSAIAIASAARVITHTRPVFAALWFIMVVLASAGLLLVLNAEFMAFAMVIIYGGAILVTYMFVIMLASTSEGTTSAGDEDASPVYDKVAREPFAAVAAGFLLLAILLSIMFQPILPNPAAADPSDKALIANTLTQRPAGQYGIDDVTDPDEKAAMQQVLGAADVENAQRVGLDLFDKHPLGIELAGVILLVALIGAVVIARQRVEDEPSTAAPGEGGATAHPTTEPGPHSPETLDSASEGRVGV